MDFGLDKKHEDRRISNGNRKENAEIRFYGNSGSKRVRWTGM